MKQQQRLNYLPVVGAILLCLLVGAYLFAGKRFSKPSAAEKVKRHSVNTPADDVLKYWTADKMKSAKPAPMPEVKTPGGRKQQPRRHPEA